MALTTFIEIGYQKKLKTSVTFVDLSAAYDTVWRQGLMYKLAKTISCRNTVELINNMLTNRLLRVFLDNKGSRWRKMNDGLPQGSVLAPTLFNLYMSDLPKMEGTVFQFADDIANAYQSTEMVDGERVLTKDLTTLNTYFQRWRLKLNPNKTEVCVFHLNNKQADKTLDIRFDNVQLNHNFTPKYLGITLD